jgi:hypothetical protein
MESSVGLFGFEWLDILWTVTSLALLVLIARAISQISRARMLSATGKIGWVLLVLVLPVIGWALWSLLKPSKAATRLSSH